MFRKIKRNIIEERRPKYPRRMQQLDEKSHGMQTLKSDEKTEGQI